MHYAKITNFGYMVLFEPPQVSSEEKKRMIEESDKRLKGLIQEVKKMQGKGA